MAKTISTPNRAALKRRAGPRSTASGRGKIGEGVLYYFTKGRQLIITAGIGGRVFVFRARVGGRTWTQFRPVLASEKRRTG